MENEIITVFRFLILRKWTFRKRNFIVIVAGNYCLVLDGRRRSGRGEGTGGGKGVVGQPKAQITTNSGKPRKSRTCNE